MFYTILSVRCRCHGCRSPRRPQRQKESVVMTATVTLNEVDRRASLTLVDELKSPDQEDRFAELVVQLVALAGRPVDPSLIAAGALVLRAEHLAKLPRVTFGCNYDLDIRSFELERGLVRAINAGWLTLRSGKVQVHQPLPKPDLDSDTSAEARKLFALERRELIRIARHHLLREADDQPGRAA
jgi:hypothetical protein